MLFFQSFRSIAVFLGALLVCASHVFAGPSRDPVMPRLNVKVREPVLMMVEDTEHYNPLTDTGAAEFSKLFPSGEHTVRGEDGEEYTAAMLHQLRCLDVVRNAFATNSGIAPLTHHCLNYLRQSILCLSDTRLEPVRSPYGPRVVSFSSDYVCSDWEAVYEAMTEPLV